MIIMMTVNIHELIRIVIVLVVEASDKINIYY